MVAEMPQRIPGGGVDLSHLVQRQGQHTAPAGAAGTTPQAAQAAGSAQTPQTVDVPSLVLDVSDATFEQIAQLSAVVPIVFDIWSATSKQSAELSPLLERITREFAGRALLARVEAEANPGLVQAFQAQALPTVIALIGGRPVPLFQGTLPEAQLRDFFAQLLQLAEQHGVLGRVSAPDTDGAPSDEPHDPVSEIPEAHRAAVAAAENGDIDASVREWELVLQKAPADAEAKAALAQMKLLQRLQGHAADELRAAAAERPEDTAAQLSVADLDLSGGHVEDAFLRLLDLFAAGDADTRTVVRERLLELFEVVGVADPRVIAARSKLASLLY